MKVFSFIINKVNTYEKRHAIIKTKKIKQTGLHIRDKKLKIIFFFHYNF